MTIVGALCPLFHACAATALGAVGAGSGRRTRRDAVLLGAVLWGVWLVAGTELLGAANALTRPALIAWWGLPSLVLLGAIWRMRAMTPAGRAARQPVRLDWPATAMTVSVLALLLALGAVAALTPPNNWDAQSYHLSRQVFWMQQGSVAHFPTENLRQTTMPPFAEFAGLHLMILAGNDHWANLVQWFALAITAIGASLIARELGAAARGQALAALLVVCNPMAAMQAVNPKNDVVTAAWLCMLALYVLRVHRTGRCRAVDAALLGATLGLLLLTKGTAYLFALPLCAVAAVAILRAQGIAGLRTGLLIGLAALLLNVGHFARNWQEFGAPLGPGDAHTGTFPLMNERFDAPALASNVMRNLALHAATPDPALNAALGQAITRVHERWLGISPGDPQTTYGFEGFRVIHGAFSEDSAPAPVHLVLALLVVPLLLLRGRGNAQAALLAGVLAAAFILFCWLLRWQPWNARLHLPLVSLLCPVAATLIARGGRGIPALACAALALAVVLPSVLYNAQKPLVDLPGLDRESRLAATVRTRPAWLQPLHCLDGGVKRLAPTTVGIRSNGNEWEYLVQRVVMDALPQAPRFVALAHHPASRHRAPLVEPEVIIGIGDPLLWLDRAATRYVAVSFCPPMLTVFLPQDAAARYGALPAPPAFVGWRTGWLSLMGDFEGPYPEQDLPLVRWGLGPASVLEFASDGRGDVLVLDARPVPGIAQTLQLELNGVATATLELGAEAVFRQFRIPLAARRGSNVLRIGYSGWERNGERPLALLYRSLQIMPASRDADPVPVPAANPGVQH